MTHVPKEKQVVNRIMAAAKKIPGLVLRKRHGTAFGCAGDPDLTGCFRGRHVEIEVKVPYESRSQLTRLQVQRQAEWAASGALVGVARSVPEFLAILACVAPEILRPAPATPTWVCAGCGTYRWQGEDAPARCPRCGHIHFTRKAERELVEALE